MCVRTPFGVLGKASPGSSIYNNEIKCNVLCIHASIVHLGWMITFIFICQFTFTIVFTFTFTFTYRFIIIFILTIVFIFIIYLYLY